MDYEKDSELNEKIIQLNKKFNKYIKKTQNTQRAQNLHISRDPEIEDSSLVEKQKAIIQQQVETIVKQEQEIKELREIAKKTLKYIKGVKNLI